MPTDLAHRYPDVRHFMATILLGDGSLDDELVGYVEGVSSLDVVRSTIAGIRGLLASPEVDDDALDEFVLDNAHRFVDRSGRRTLEHIADRLQQLLDHPPPPHPLTVRFPALAAFLESHTRSHGHLDDLVRGGAATDPEAAAAAREGTALLEDPALTDAELVRFVRAHSWWLLDGSARRTVEQVVDVLHHPEPVGHDEARALAEAVLDRDVRPRYTDEVVIVDQHTQESATTWAFVYNSRTYVETGSMLDMIVGNAPVLVDKSTGRSRIGRSDLSVAEQI